MSAAPREPFSSAASVRIAALFTALAVAMVLSPLIPPFQSPDEFDHVKRAAALTSGQILVTRADPGGSPGLWVDEGLLFYMQVYDRLPFRTGTRVTMAMVRDGNEALWRGTTRFSPAPGVGYYFPIIYLPQSLGLLAGKTFGWTIDSSYRLARLMVVISTLAILSAAFALFPMNFFTLGLLVLPTTLFQMTSATIDALTMALAVLCAALFLRGAGGRFAFPPWMGVTLSVAIVVLATCRMNMAVLILMPLFLYFVRRERLYLYSTVVCVVLIAAWAAAALSTTHTFRAGIEQPVSEVALHYLFHPWEFPAVLWATFSNGAIVQLYVRQLIGTLGWLEPKLPTWFYVTEVGALAIAFVLSIFAPGRLTRARWALAAMSLAVVVVLFALLLITWTRHPATVVMGVQGRYFLLPLLLLSCALHGDAEPLRTKRAHVALPILAVTTLIALYVMADALLQKYYVSPAMWLG